MHLLRPFFVIVICSVTSLQLLTSLTGCAQVKSYSPAKVRPGAIVKGKLKGLNKVEVIKKFGNPVTTSKSGISESWYYKEPRDVWIWFKDGKVTHWETK